jgi:small ligand-binding sensory domain FIST
VKVSGVGCQVSAIKKFQIIKNKYQTNHNDLNSKSQTDDPSAFVPNGIITGGQKFGQRYDTTALDVLVIGY